MHSLESLREIRAMNYMLYGGLSEEEYFANPRPLPISQQNTGKVIAVARYNLATGEITVERPSPEGDLVAQLNPC